MKLHNNSRRIYRFLAAAAASVMLFTACMDVTAASGEASAELSTSSAVQASAEYTAESKSEMFTERDLSGSYDASEAVTITLSGDTAAADKAQGLTIEGSIVTISEEGTYILTGTLDDGQIIVDADDSAKVQIVLNGADITSSDSAAVYVRSADKVFITTAEGTENTLANGGSFSADSDTNIDAAVFAKDDITLNGSGILNIESPAGHGIAGKDDVKLAGGTIRITASGHGVQAKDSVRIAEADITVSSGSSKDGIHVSGSSDEASEESTDSYFYMSDGSLKIDSGDDGIHADAEAVIEGGTISITDSYEGIEALKINISGGDISLTASDDGLNAAGGTSGSSSGTFGSDDWSGGMRGFDEGGTDGEINISGGKIYIRAGGDGIDANGAVEISGGYTVVCGPSRGDTSVLDYNTEAKITGGTFIGTGGAGMAENFSSAEGQGVIAVSTGSQSAGSKVTLTDQSGNIPAEVTPELDYSSVFISTPDVQQGSTYSLSCGSYSEDIELTESLYSTISGGMGGFGGGPGQGSMDAFGGDSGQSGMGGFGGGPGQGSMDTFDGDSGQSGMGGFGGGPGQGSMDTFGGDSGQGGMEKRGFGGGRP